MTAPRRTHAAPADRPVLSAADLRHATEVGIVTADQAEALLASVRSAPEPARPRGAPPPAIPVAVEIVGYLGAAMAAIGAATLVAQFWSDMAPWSRLALLGSLAAASWGAGAAVDESTGPAPWRLRGFLWLLSSAGSAAFAGVLGVDLFAWGAEGVAVLVGAVTALHAGALWRLRDRPAQHLACAAGVVGVLAGTGAWVGASGTVGLVLWAFGVTWLVLGWRRRLVPASVALAAAPALMLVAAGVTGGSWPSFAPLLGLVTAAGLVAVGTLVEEFPVTGVGILGLFVYLPMAGAEYFGETVGVPIVLLVAGVLLILLMLHLLRRRAGSVIGPRSPRRRRSPGP